MAAVTINRRRSFVFGNKRAILADVSVAGNGDTLDTKLHIIDAASVDSSSTAAVGVTLSGGVMTFVTVGAVTHAQIMAYGN
jgi:hypothetical protein